MIVHVGNSNQYDLFYIPSCDGVSMPNHVITQCLMQSLKNKKSPCVTGSNTLMYSCPLRVAVPVMYNLYRQSCISMDGVLRVSMISIGQIL